MSAALHSTPDSHVVLCKALFKASAQLTLIQEEIGKTIGMNRTSISKLKVKGRLDPASKSGEIALILIRIARALYALSGGDEQWISHFMRSYNKVTGGVPAEQIQTVQGLTRVMQFLDAMRGKV